jgi:lipoprotein-anchoring transpeptidase ErfK/SrfK
VLERRRARRGLWLHVALPRRPNGASGWIPADVARLSRTPYRVEISTARRTLALLRAGKAVLRTRVVVGKPSTPTPRGLFAIAERVPQPSAAGFLGPWALLLTAFSDNLRSYGGGPGQVAVHGRAGASLRDPLGSARSHGCVRIPNSAITILARRPEGTPVKIR